MDLTQLKALYRETLLDDVIPWWEKHGLDRNGGINTCIRDDGTLVSRDRWNWSQWRAVWVFSKLYNTVEPRKRWLEIARAIYEFVTANGPLPNGHWPLLLGGDGELKRGYESIYVDGFALYGLAELYRATSDPAVYQHAVRTLEAFARAMEYEDPPPAWPYPIPQGWWPHGLSMIASITCHELSNVLSRPEARALADHHHRHVMQVCRRDDRGVVLEWLQRDGREVPPPEGTVVVPGHAIESMWFQIHIALSRSDSETVKTALDAIRRHLERGWDEEHGGLYLAVDAEGSSTVGWDHAEKKLWWPHTEALYATLLAHYLSDESWPLQWHHTVREWTYHHFPVADHGEWTQKLDRYGNVLTEDLVLPVKDPFHLPRALIYMVLLLENELKA